MKIKYNFNKDTFSINKLTPTEFAVINALMSHVRLGMEDTGSSVAFEFCSQVDTLDMSDETGMVEGVIPDVTIIAEPCDSDDNTTVMLQDPILEVYVD
jgi:hypothetical protein